MRYLWALWKTLECTGDINIYRLETCGVGSYWVKCDIFMMLNATVSVKKKNLFLDDAQYKPYAEPCDGALGLASERANWKQTEGLPRKIFNSDPRRPHSLMPGCDELGNCFGPKALGHKSVMLISASQHWRPGTKVDYRWVVDYDKKFSPQHLLVKVQKLLLMLRKGFSCLRRSRSDNEVTTAHTRSSG